jgi:hypothetical protein
MSVTLLVLHATLLGLLLWPAVAPAQVTPPVAPSTVAVEVAPEGATQEIRLRDGTTALGRVTAVDGTHLTFVTQGGVSLSVALADVVALTTLEGRVTNGQFWKADPNPTRLFFGPTGRALSKGDVYLGVYELFIPFVQVGLTDRISIGGGTPLLFSSGETRPFWFTPKVTVVSRPRTQLAVGAMHMANIDGDNLGIAYAAVTQGSRDSAVTVGAGVAYSRFEDTSPPVVMLGLEHRVHRSLKLVSESYVFEGGGIVSGGVRFLTGRLSADLGLAAPLGVDEVVVFPMVNFVWTFQ